MIKNSTKGYRTLSDIGAERDLAEITPSLWWARHCHWTTHGMKNMPWWYYQARNNRARKQKSPLFGKGRLHVDL